MESVRLETSCVWLARDLACVGASVAGRECQPGLCAGHAKAAGARACANIGLRQGRSKRLMRMDTACGRIAVGAMVSNDPHRLCLFTVCEGSHATVRGNYWAQSIDRACHCSSPPDVLCLCWQAQKCLGCLQFVETWDQWPCTGSLPCDGKGGLQSITWRPLDPGAPL